MNYSPLSVHCTSLCLDVICDRTFLSLTQDDIRNHYPDIYRLVYERIDERGQNDAYLLLLSALITRKILAVLSHYLHHPCEVEVSHILLEIDDVVGSFFNKYS